MKMILIVWLLMALIATNLKGIKPLTNDLYDAMEWYITLQDFSVVFEKIA